MKTNTRMAVRHLPFVCLSMFCASTLLGQANMPAASSATTPEEEPVNLNPFTVSETQRSPWNSQQTFSGSRIAENIMDVPINISILTGDFIQSIGATTLTELLNYAGSGVNQRVSY